MKRALASGAAGALALTALHEMTRRRVEYAPRMDLVAMRGLRRLLPRDRRELDERRLHRLALAGDLVSNSIYYAAVPASTVRATWMRAAVLGTAAGIGAVLLPEPMGLGAPPHSDRRANQVMTVAWYVGGAVAAAAVANLIGRRRRA